MTLADLQALATMVLALSAANERLIEALKNLLAPWLATPPTVEKNQIAFVPDRYRQLRVQIATILTAWVTAAWLAGHNRLDFLGSISVGNAGLSIPVFLLALLTSGGAAFWNSILDYVRAANKVRQQQAADQRVRLYQLEQQTRVQPQG